MAVQLVDGGGIVPGGGMAQDWGLYLPGMQVYTWLAADFKPQTPPPGSIGFEFDTGRKWFWTGTTWMLETQTKVAHDTWFPVHHAVGANLRSGNNEVGTAIFPLRINPTGTTAQPVTVADGVNIALGSKADAAVTDSAISASLIALIKGLLSIFTGGSGVWHSAAKAINVLLRNSAGTEIATETNPVRNDPVGYNYTHVNTAGATFVKSGSGFLHTVTINERATNRVITLYDNTVASGTEIAMIRMNLDIGSLIYDLKFNTGLTVYLGAGTENADLTVTWR